MGTYTIAKLKPGAQPAVTNVASAQQQLDERYALMAKLQLGAQPAVTYAGRTSDLQQQLDDRATLDAMLQIDEQLSVWTTPHVLLFHTCWTYLLQRILVHLRLRTGSVPPKSSSVFTEEELTLLRGEFRLAEVCHREFLATNIVSATEAVHMARRLHVESLDGEEEENNQDQFHIGWFLDPR